MTHNAYRAAYDEGRVSVRTSDDAHRALPAGAARQVARLGTWAMGCAVAGVVLLVASVLAPAMLFGALAAVLYARRGATVSATLLAIAYADEAAYRRIAHLLSRRP